MAARRNVSSGSPYEPKIGISRAVRVGNRVLVSGTAPIWPDGSCDPDPAAQARRCFEIIVVVVTGFLDPRWKVEIEAEAVVGA